MATETLGVVVYHLADVGAGDSQPGDFCADLVSAADALAGRGPVATVAEWTAPLTEWGEPEFGHEPDLRAAVEAWADAQGVTIVDWTAVDDEPRLTDGIVVARVTIARGVSNRDRIIAETTVTAGDLTMAQVAQYPGVPAGVTPEDLVPVGADEILWVTCPADYNPKEITAEDIVYDSAITVVEPGSRWLIDADTNETIGVATLEQIEASDEAAERGELGLILIDADGVVVHPGEEDEPWTAHPVRRVYVEGPLPGGDDS